MSDIPPFIHKFSRAVVVSVTVNYTAIPVPQHTLGAIHNDSLQKYVLILHPPSTFTCVRIWQNRPPDLQLSTAA